MIYISLGSNLGSRINNLRHAVDLISEGILSNIRCSNIIETEAILPKNAPPAWNKPFLNMVISGEAKLSPHALLTGLKAIEQEIGRPAVYEKWSPRIIDLDILLIDDAQLDDPQLTIPHPELNNRPFLLHLLAMMGLQNCHPQACSGSKPTDSEILNQVQDDRLYRPTKSLSLHPALVGIVNVTPDSFSDGGLYNNTDQAVEKIWELARNGASVIDIGAQSTRPGAGIIGPGLEYQRLKPVLDSLAGPMDSGDLQISVDSFWPEIIHKLLSDYQISWINDVKGELDDDTLKMIADKKCKYCIMHSLSVPVNSSEFLPSDANAMSVIKEWGSRTIERLLKLGLALDNIILDPGIGFGKTPYQNLDILRSISELKILGTQIMIGHSRKSYISALCNAKAIDRDLETIAISLGLMHDVDFLRVHDVEGHMRAMVAYNAVT
jgi:2-amino-4-hydroxy-6-hydroxymethyldihydropteridine diphosphokinase / dihydropteroate synthase